MIVSYGADLHIKELTLAVLCQLLLSDLSYCGHCVEHLDNIV